MLISKTVISFGEILWDILPTRTVLGGAPFNLAFRVNALGERGLIASRLGQDELGRRAFAEVVSLGLDTRYLQWDEHHPTGTVRVTLGAGGDPTFLILPDVAYDYIEISDSLLKAARSADYFFYGTLSQRAPKTRKTLEALLEAAGGCVKLLDLNLRVDCYTEDTVRWSLEHCDILKINEQEARELSAMFFGPFDSIPIFAGLALQRWSLDCCLVTLGERGAFALSGDQGAVYFPGYRVEVADTVGAGDAFTAGFLHSLAGDLPFCRAVEFGNLLGALVSTKKGGTAPVDPLELEKLGEEKNRRMVDPRLESFSKG